MPIFAGVLISLMSGLATWLGQFFAAKAAWTIAVVAASTASMLVLWLVIQTAVTALMTSFPNFPHVEMVLYLVVPSNFPLIASTLTTAEAGFAVWRWHRFNLQLAA